MEDHIYEDPDLDLSTTSHGVTDFSSYPVKPVSDVKSGKKGEKKKKQGTKGLGILKNLRRKDKQVPVSTAVIQEKSRVSSGKRLGKGFDGSSASGTKHMSSERNYYIKEGKQVASSRPSKEDVKVKHTQHSAQRSRPTMADEDDTALSDSSLSPPPLPNRRYLLDTAFIAELEGFPTTAEDEAPLLPERYYEDIDYVEGNGVSSRTRGDIDVDGYVDVPRNINCEESGEESDEYIEAELHHERNIEAESGDESDEYIEAELRHEQSIEYINVARRSGYDSDDDYITVPR